MSAKGMSDIDELLAEITGDKPKRTMSDTGEIDNILKSLGKNPGNKRPASTENVAKPAANKTVNNTQPLTAAAAKKADTLFDSFFENNFGQDDKSAKTAPKESSGRFDDAMFAETFGANPEKKETASPKKLIEDNETGAEKATAHGGLFKKEKRGVSESRRAKKRDENLGENISAMQTGNAVRKIETTPDAGSLRGKIVSASISGAFATEEDEEYPPLAPKSADTDKSDAFEKAFAEFGAKDTALGEALQGNSAEKTSDLKNNALAVNSEEKTDESEALNTKETPTVEFSIQNGEAKAPTLEFPVQGGKAVKKTNGGIVVRPENDNSSADKSAIRKTQSVVMSEVDDTFREFFGETVAVSRSEIEEGLKAKKSNGFFGRLFAQPNDENDEIEQDIYDEGESEEEVTDDYNSPSDAAGVEATLTSMRSTATLRVIATALTCALLLYLGLSARTGLLPSIPVLDPTNEPLLYLVANFALLLISGLVCITGLIGGFVSIFKEPSADLLTSVCFTGAFLQNLAYLIKPNEFDPAAITLFAPVAALALFASALGKRIQCTTVCRNFETVSVGYDHSAAYVLKNREIAAKVCRELDDDEPALLVSRPTALVKGFLRQSFSTSSAAKSARILSFIVFGTAVVAFIYSMATTGGFLPSLTAFAAVCTLCAPFSASLVFAVPASLMQKSTARVGAIVPGWSAIEALGEVNAVLVNAKDLFPRESVRLHGIKTFEKERIDLAILYAASVLVEGCDTLRDIFLNVIENKTEMLYKVDSLTLEPGLGFTAWIEHTRVIVGNRAIMQKHDIALPSLDYEMKYTKGERSPIYLAVAGKLFGMFLVSYSPCEEADEVLFGLVNSGVSIVVKSDDFNLTGDMVAQLYGLNRSQVKVLNAAERDALSPLTAYLPESEGILTHLGTLTSFSGGLRAAAAAQSGVKLAAIIQAAATALGILLCVLLIFSKSLISISLTAVLLFQLAWTVLTAIVPLTKRY